MKFLLHTCCAPCLTYPLSVVRERKVDVTVYFFNPNIHPFKEFKKRKDCLYSYTERNNIRSVIIDDYGLVDFTRRVAFNEEERCSICYDLRLEQTVHYAKINGFTSFSTTLLYSKYQNHNLIKKNVILFQSNIILNSSTRILEKGGKVVLICPLAKRCIDSHTVVVSIVNRRDMIKNRFI